MIGVATCSIRVAQGRDVLLLGAPCFSLLPNFVFQIYETAMASETTWWQQYFRDAPPQPGDERVGNWSHAQLVRMDNRFRARLLRAFNSGATQSPATSIIPRLLTIATYFGRAPMPIGWLRAIEENPMTLF